MTADHEAAIREAADRLADALVAAVCAHAAPGPERLLSIDEAAAALGIGRSRVYVELGAGRLRSLKAGRRRLVPQSAVTDFAERLAG